MYLIGANLQNRKLVLRWKIRNIWLKIGTKNSLSCMWLRKFEISWNFSISGWLVGWMNTAMLLFLATLKTFKDFQINSYTSRVSTESLPPPSIFWMRDFVLHIISLKIDKIRHKLLNSKLSSWMIIFKCTIFFINTWFFFFQRSVKF